MICAGLGGGSSQEGEVDRRANGTPAGYVHHGKDEVCVDGLTEHQRVMFTMGKMKSESMG